MKVKHLIQVAIYLVDGTEEWYATATVCRPTSMLGLIALHGAIAAEVAAHVAEHCGDRFGSVCFYTEWFTAISTDPTRVWRDLYWERQQPKGSYPPVLTWEYDGTLPNPDIILPGGRNGEV